MKLLQALINYDSFPWHVQLSIGILCVLISVLIFLLVKNKLCKNATEFEDAPKIDSQKESPEIKAVDDFIKANCDECQHEPVLFKVGQKTYSTEDGARMRCEHLFKKNNVDADVSVIFPNDIPVKCKASDIWNFTGIDDKLPENNL